MREIKFRAWDDREKQMSSRIELDFYGRIEVNVAFATMLREGHVTLMQFIGQHDRDGKEIYEDDIVRVRGGRPLQIKWNDSYLGYPNSGCEYESSIEVIGNVYENPELLR